MSASTPPAGPRVAVIHTSPATVAVFGPLIQARAPDATVFNLLDDSILPELRENGGDVEAILPRWRAFARIARERGADVILNACSSIGALSEVVGAEMDVPVLRVDAAMAREAVRRGPRVSVIATLASTLRPTAALIERTAAEAGRPLALRLNEVPGAYEALMAGDQPRHDALVAAAIAAEARVAEAVVLAQASMARVLPTLPADAAARCLTSPPFAADAVTKALHAGRRGSSAP